MREGEVPGLSIVLIRDGRIYWQGGFGVKNAEKKSPLDDATVFETASLTKPVLAYPVLKLVDSGKLDLDFAWMNYDRYDSRKRIQLRAYNAPIRALFDEILERGEAAISDYRRTRKSGSAVTLLNENQVNSLGYWLKGKKRLHEAIEVFKMNTEDFPNSSNAYDSLGEAYMDNGDKELAIKNYKRSLELNPSNLNAIEMIKRLQNR